MPAWRPKNVHAYYALRRTTLSLAAAKLPTRGVARAPYYTLQRGPGKLFLMVRTAVFIFARMKANARQLLRSLSLSSNDARSLSRARPQIVHVDTQCSLNLSKPHQSYWQAAN